MKILIRALGMGCVAFLYTVSHAATMTFQEGVSPSGGYSHGATYILSFQNSSPNEAYGPNGNIDVAASMVVGNSAFFGNGSPTASTTGARTLLSWDLAPLLAAGGGNAANINVTSAKLILFARGTTDGSTGTVTATNANTGVGTNININLHHLDESFDETTVTWNNLTPDGGSVTGTLLNSLSIDPTPGTVGNFVTWDSTAAFVSTLQTELTGDGVLGLILRRAPNAGNDSNTYARFYGDYSTIPLDKRPQLVVEYSVVPEPGTWAMLLVGATLAMGLFVRRTGRAALR